MPRKKTKRSLDPAAASERGKKGRWASPWSNAPMCNTPRAKKAFAENNGKGPTH